MKLKNKNIKIGNILSTHKFISGDKYYKIDKAEFEGSIFTKGTRVSYIDPDEEGFVEWVGKIEYIIVTEKGDVEVSIDNLSVGGRLNLEELCHLNY